MEAVIQDNIVLMEHTYDVLKNSDNVKYLSLKSMLSNTGLFNSSTISNIVNSSTQNVVGIIQATKVGTTTTVIGYTKETFFFWWRRMVNLWNTR